MTPAEDAARGLRVGVIGLGRMGSTIARHLADHHDVAGWDVRPVDLPGVTRAADPAALADDRDVILACLPSPVETATVVEDDRFLAAYRGGPAICVDCSTSDPASLRALAARIGDASERLLDAPILGRPDRVGQWTIPVGGDAVAAERVRPVLERLAQRVEHVGPLGSAHAIKLLNNLMFGAINLVTAEAIGACERVGVDPARFVDLVGGSNAATVSPLFRDLAPRMLGADEATVFTTALLAKDAALARDMCEAAGVPVRLAGPVAAAAADAVGAGLGERDSAALVELYRSANATEAAVLTASERSSSGPTEDRVLAAEDAYVAAELAADRTALERIVDDRFVFNAGDGTTGDKASLIDDVLRMNMTGQRLSERSVLIEGGVALIFGTTEIRTASAEGEERASTLRYTSTYVERDGAWRLLGLQMQRRSG